MSDPEKKFRGSWLITLMETWDPDAIDTLGPGFIRFDEDGLGELRFCTVEGGIDCRFGERNGKPLVEFSWAGNEEMDEASGRGWAILEEEGRLSGEVFIHQGDDSKFRATRAGEARSRKRTQRRE